jgi:hypothetical protein
MSKSYRGAILIDTGVCKGCFLCVAASPPEVLVESRL